MIYSFFAYFLTLILVLTILNLKHKRTCRITRAKMFKNGITFFSTARHRLFLPNCKYLVVGNDVYIKHENKELVIKNVKDVNRSKDFLCFTSLGHVYICFDVHMFYKYFNFKILSKQFELETVKKEAVAEMLNNLLCPYSSTHLKQYINIIKNVLNIDVSAGVSVGRNKYNLSYILIYKIKGKIRKIYVNNPKFY